MGAVKTAGPLAHPNAVLSAGRGTAGTDWYIDTNSAMVDSDTVTVESGHITGSIDPAAVDNADNN